MKDLIKHVIWRSLNKISDYKYLTILQLLAVGGNANFRMTQTSFTSVGFTQPQVALPIIEDIQNNAKGFTSRVLWLFREPVYCRMQDSMLTQEESEQLKEFRNQLGKWNN